MQNLQLDLAAGQSVSIGEYRVTLVSTTDIAATFEIEGPGGNSHRHVVPVNKKSADNSTNITA
ncbi:MAG: hypothetical protein ABJZ55_19875 [Fuerstiella sp.]